MGIDEDSRLHSSSDDFRKAISPKKDNSLNVLLRQNNDHIVYAGQQLYLDYRKSVVDKIIALNGLSKDESISAFFLWLDTDRVGSDKPMSKIRFNGENGLDTFSFSDSSNQDKELRYARTELASREKAADRLYNYLSGTSDKNRLKTIRNILKTPEHCSLKDLNYAVTDHILKHYGILEIGVKPILGSELLKEDFFKKRISLLIENIDDVIQSYNEAIDNDPKLKMSRLEDDFFPLFYSCTKDDYRFRVSRKGSALSFNCRCGNIETFDGAEGLMQTDRWSPGIFIPIYLNPFTSGMVVGKSSARYGRVMNHVLENVFGERPVEMLLAESNYEKGRHDSLLYNLLNADYQKGQ